MLASAIRELAASKDSPWLAAALFKKTVQIWDLQSQTKITEFPTVFCSGARNLALAPLGDILIAGLSTRQGKVAAYDVPSGKKLWEQRLVYPSLLRFHPSGQSIFCTRNERSVLRLDVQTGNILEVIDGTTKYIEDFSGDSLTVPDADDPVRLIGSGQMFNISRPRNAVLDAQFSPHFVCLTEVRGPVRCISRVDGKLQWMFDPDPGSRVLRLHYSSTRDAFFGILTTFEKGRPRTLLRFDPTSGVSECVCEFYAWEQVFLDTTDQLVTSAGEIRYLSDGALAGRLDFPVKEYPDN